MKKTVSLLLVIGLVVLLYRLYNPEAQPLKPVHQSSGGQSLSTDNNTNKQQKKKDKKQTNKADDFIEQAQEQILNQSEEKQEEEIDYISAYRDWEYFANCFTDVEDFHNEKDPLDTLAERFANNPRESQTEPTPQQNSYYQHHVEVCKSLTEDENDDYYQIREKLYAKFLKIIPKTPQEKQLEHALDMVKQMDAFAYEYSRAFRSKSTLPEAEILALNLQIEELTRQMLDVYESTNDLSEEQLAQITEFNNQIKSIRLRINSSKQVDREALAKIENIMDGYINSMDDYLHHVQSPDAFLLIAQSIYKAQYYQKDSTLIRQLKDQTGIKDSYYINILNTLVLPLVACSMDYPCDAESDIMLSYCLGLKDSMFNQACGLTLEDFYFSFYIGANQLNDVNIYFNHMVNKYAP